jgi:hypothetical protein
VRNVIFIAMGVFVGSTIGTVIGNHRATTSDDNIVVGDKVIENDLAPCEVCNVTVGSFFRHNGEVWVRLSPDPGADVADDDPAVQIPPPLVGPRPEWDQDVPKVTPPFLDYRVLVARVSGPRQGRAEAVPLSGKTWIRKVQMTCIRAREEWED